MSTKVHDEDDETFDEVDEILENAKAGMQMKRSLERKTRRNINLSDIPENFAHVPASSTARRSELTSSRSPTVVAPSPSPQVQAGADRNRGRYKKTQQRSLVQATLRWLRSRYTGCVSAVHGTSCGMCGCNVAAAVHVPSRRRVTHRP